MLRGSALDFLPNAELLKKLRHSNSRGSFESTKFLGQNMMHRKVKLSNILPNLGSQREKYVIFAKRICLIQNNRKSPTTLICIHIFLRRPIWVPAQLGWLKNFLLKHIFSHIAVFCRFQTFLGMPNNWLCCLFHKLLGGS